MADEGWDEDDDMDELFSFGAEGATAPDVPAENPPAADEEDKPAIAEDADDSRARSGSTDSFLDLLDESNKNDSLEGGPVPIDDAETKEILDWLDEDDRPIETAGEETPATKDTKPDSGNDDEKTEPPKEKEPPSPKSKEVAAKDATPVTAATIVQLPPKFTFLNLKEAVASSESTIDQIRDLFVDEGMKIDAVDRPALWCRFVCGRSLERVNESSMAEAFRKWRQDFDLESRKDERTEWIKGEATILAERIVAVDDAADKTLEDAKSDLCAVLVFHYESAAKRGEDEANTEMDSLFPPVVGTILSTGMPPAVASVVLSSIVPKMMPLLGLTHKERLEAAKTLHTQFYQLASYHLPLLVFHLDRYAPGWQWPKRLGETSEAEDSATSKGRNLEKQGVIPQSWLISHLAGESRGTNMNPMWLMSLWDLILTSSNNSLRFFLALSVLEKNSDTLLLTTGHELKKELERIMDFKEGTTLEGFAIESEDETTSSEATDWVQEWCNRARALWESTPRSVVSKLRRCEDRAVTVALQERHRIAEEKLQAKLEAEAQAHKAAMEAERERRSDEARRVANELRLSSFYRKHCPEKEKNITKIMEKYEGRLGELDAKLKGKYGTGFHPLMKPLPVAKNTKNLLSSMNTGLTNQRKKFTKAFTSGKKDEAVEAEGVESYVTLSVAPTEVLPIVCWSKESNRGERGNRPCDALKFYLVDSRPEDTVEEQGKFPTALAMSPEVLLDPDRIQQYDEMFESLRGAVHLVIMGEGFSAVPRLYGHKMNAKLTQLIEEDQSRTSLCALFFLKRGFPFVSILDGGFAAAHAWLWREGPRRHLRASSVLVDYDGEMSLFGVLESAYQEQQRLKSASTAAKTQHALTNLFEGSLASVTRNKTRLENLAANTEARQQVRERVTKFFVRNETDENVPPPPAEPKEKTEPRFHNPFASLGKTVAENLRRAETSGDKPQGDVDEITTSSGETPATESRFKNAFAGIGKAVATNLRKTGDGAAPIDAGQDGLETASGAPRLRNPFAGMRAVAPDSGPSEDGGTTPGATSASTKAQNALSRFAKVTKSAASSAAQVTKSAASSAAQATKSAASTAAQATKSAASSAAAAARSTDADGNKKNRFSGLGAALNKTLKSEKGQESRLAGLGSALSSRIKLPRDGTPTEDGKGAPIPSMLTRNPFNRFGSGNTDKSPRSFGNMKMPQMRSGMTNFRSSRRQDEQESEDTISFFEEDPRKEENADGQSATESGGVEPVIVSM